MPGARALKMAGLLENLYKEHLNVPPHPNLKRTNGPFPPRQKTGDLFFEDVDIGKI